MEKKLNLSLTIRLFVGLSCVVFFLLSSIEQTQAQTSNTIVIQGVVYDKNGNVFSGVTIEAAGGITSTQTGEDGTFSMEVSRWLTSIKASAPGMHDIKVKLKGQKSQNLIIKMKEDPEYNPKGLKGNMTLHGTIIDKNGNGLPGVKIESGENELNTVTDADGSFSLEIPRSSEKVRITYPGLSKTVVYLHGRADEPLIIKMSKWTSKLLSEGSSYSLFPNNIDLD